MTDREANGRLNATLLDPQRWGWTAASGVADLLTPHERARRSAAKKAFFRSKRKRDSKEASSSTSETNVAGDERDANSDEPAKRPAHDELNQSADDYSLVAKDSAVVQSRGDSSDPNKKPSSRTASVQIEATTTITTTSTASSTAETPSIAAAAVASTNHNGLTVFSALRHPITGNETADCLDWYTYHRGRTSQEKRDEQTGELQFDLPNPTDTNHFVDEPNWSNAKISIRFPLDDRNRRMEGTREGRKSVFREVVFWDWLGNNSLIVDAEAEDGEPPAHIGILEKTPMEIAGTIAVEYGLSFPETIDLAEYIQGQLRTWVQQEASTAPPLTYTDPHTGQRREKPNTSLTDLYGNVIGMAEGGFEDKPGAGVLQRSFPIPRRLSSVESSKKSTKGKSSGQRKETKKSVKVDQECIEEVRRRLLAESTEDIKTKSVGKDTVGELTVKRGLSCHICQQIDGSFGQFACGQTGHSFCREHTKHKFSLPLDAEHVALAYCPVCSLHCSCDSCIATLEKLAADFKLCNVDQDCPVQDTKFDGLLLLARTNRVAGTKKNKGRWKNKSGTFLTEKTIVPKVPVTDLPREVSEGIDVDPGTDADYAATYGPSGPTFPPGLSFSVKPAGSDLATKTSFTLEDGSVDFCNICRNHGNLLCCDFCPRAFHAKCLQASDVDENSDNPWECPSCRAETAGIDEDKVDGSKSLEKINNAYGSSVDGSGNQNMLLLLATIDQMLLRLINYDFGYVFREPVDTNQFPEYLKTVKKPMDLGTISKKLSDGSYRESDEESLESIAIKALQDVELVWKNCYRFNVDGSSVYRMALVQERRAKAIRNASFSNLLTERILSSLGYDSTPSEVSRAKPSRAAGLQGAVRPQKSRHKITVSRRRQNGRPIAVLDPDSRKIVKIYSTMQAAGAAVVFLLGVGHKCEWHNIEIDTVQKTRKVIKDSHDKISYTLFGYRWLDLDFLRNGRVSFPKDDPTSLKNKGEPSVGKRNGTNLQENFYSTKSISDEVGLKTSGDSGAMEVDGTPSENCQDIEEGGPENCTETGRVANSETLNKTNDCAVSDARKSKGNDLEGANRLDQNTLSNGAKHPGPKSSLPTKQDTAILTNGSNAKLGD